MKRPGGLVRGAHSWPDATLERIASLTMVPLAARLAWVGRTRAALEAEKERLAIAGHPDGMAGLVSADDLRVAIIDAKLAWLAKLQARLEVEHADEGAVPE